MADACHADSVYDQQPAGHRLGPALIAFLVVLAAAAGAVGYFGTRSVLTANGTPTAGATTGPTTPATGTGGQTVPSSGPGSAGGQTGPTTHASLVQVPPGDPQTCPQPTVTAVNKAGLDDSLSVVLYVRVHRDGEYDSEVWICKNAAGLLIYQGHVLRGPLDVGSGDNSLLLADGISGSVQATADGFTAVNPTTGGKSTEYRVSRTTLTIVNEPGDRNPQDYPVVFAAP